MSEPKLMCGNFRMLRTASTATGAFFHGVARLAAYPILHRLETVQAHDDE